MAYDLGVQRAPSLLKQAAIRHLMGQGMLEGVFQLGEKARFVEEFGGLQAGEAAVDRLLGQLSNGLQQAPGDVVANDRGGLEEAFFLGWEPIDARGQHRLHRGRDVNGRLGLCQLIGPRFAH